MTTPYVNRVWLQGRVISTPSLKALNQRTSVTSFLLSMVESWENASGATKERRNRILIEVVGRDAASVAETTRVGYWASIEGYIRSELFKGQELVKVRTFRITTWEAGSDRSTEASGRP